MPTLAYIGIFAKDSEQLLGFYRDVFGFAEVENLRSPVFRVLSTGLTHLGFYADAAYDRLNLQRPAAQQQGAEFMLTIDVDTEREVDRLVTCALAKGASLAKAAEATHYGWYMTVLQDPEGNVVRIGAAITKN